MMIASISSLRPQEVFVRYSPQFDVKTISICHEVIGEMYIIAVYRHPQLISTYLLSFYLECVPHETVPTVIMGDFNNNLLSPDHSTGIIQLLKVNFPESKPTVHVVDTYYTDHDGTYLSIPIGAHSSHS